MRQENSFFVMCLELNAYRLKRCLSNLILKPTYAREAFSCFKAVLLKSFSCCFSVVLRRCWGHNSFFGIICDGLCKGAAFDRKFMFLGQRKLKRRLASLAFPNSFPIFLFIPFFVAYAFHVKSLVVESAIQTSYQDDKIHVHSDIRVKKTLQDRKQKPLACQNEISGV